jgi:hypothetical protein
MVQWQKDMVVDRERLDPDELEGRIPIGEWYAES